MTYYIGVEANVGGELLLLFYRLLGVGLIDTYETSSI